VPHARGSVSYARREEGATPVDEAKIPPVPKTLPASIPADALRGILVRLREIDLLTFVRYAVACTTLQRPAQIGRAQPGDLNLEDGIWIVRSAKNEPAHTITLEAEAVAAWRAFVAADAFGEFDTSKYGSGFTRPGCPPACGPTRRGIRARSRRSPPA
jgi:integrase